MLIMCNVKTEYKNGDAEKTTLAFLCHLKMKVYLFFDTWIYFCCYVTIEIYDYDGAL